MEFVFTFIAIVLIQLVGTVVAPLVFIAAAVRIKGSVPGWITATMLVSSIVILLASIPGALISLVPMFGATDGWVTSTGAGLLLGASATISRIGQIALAFAVLALAGRVRHTATQLARSGAA